MTTDRPRPAQEALARALAAQVPQRVEQEALDVAALRTPEELHALADRLANAAARAQLDGGDRYGHLPVSATVEDVRRAADAVRSAADPGAGYVADLERRIRIHTALTDDLRAELADVRGTLAAAVEREARAGERIASLVVERDELARTGDLERQVAESARARKLEALEVPTPSARATDPSTSHAAAANLPKRGNQLGRLLVGFLMFYRQEVGESYPDPTLTSEELAHRIGLERSEYAKRCSDLLALGLIRVARDGDGHERTRQGRSGRQRLVFELTEDGLTVARDLAHKPAA